MRYSVEWVIYPAEKHNGFMIFERLTCFIYMLIVSRAHLTGRTRLMALAIRTYSGPKIPF